MLAIQEGTGSHSGMCKIPQGGGSRCSRVRSVSQALWLSAPSAGWGPRALHCALAGGHLRPALALLIGQPVLVGLHALNSCFWVMPPSLALWPSAQAAGWGPAALSPCAGRESPAPCAGPPLLSTILSQLEIVCKLIQTKQK